MDVVSGEYGDVQLSLADNVSNGRLIYQETSRETNQDSVICQGKLASPR